jgi:hypothetical protein
MSLSEICYEQIMDDYWYAEYLGLKVMMMRSNGFINATKLCADGSKQFYHWMGNKRSKNLVKYFDKKFNETSNQSSPTEFRGPETTNCNFQAHRKIQLYTVVQGGENYILSGTYVHPKLILDIAAWVSNEFYDLASKVVEDYAIKLWKDKLEAMQQTLDIVSLEKDVAMQTLNLLGQDNKTLLNETQGLKEGISKKKKELDIWASTHAFTMLRTNDDKAMKYYVIRCKKQEMRHGIKRLRARHPHSILAYQQNAIPNGMNLFARLKLTRRIKTKNNYFETNMREAELIDLLGKLCEVYNC